MTLIPLENRDVKGLDGPEFPDYKVPPVCSAPDCSRFVDHTHHLFRRSFLTGPYSWVELPDHTIVGNLVGLCLHHHEEVTVNRKWIRWVDGRFWWCTPVGRETGELFPQPPIHGHPQIQNPEEKIVGPAASPVCPGCRRPLPQKVAKDKREAARRRKSWVVKVPDDSAEDGALVLDVLVEECRKLFGHDDSDNLRYHTLCQALALVVQHGHLLTSDS